MEEAFSYQFFGTTKDALEAEYQAILSAKESIYFEVYIFLDDQVGQRFVDALCDKAQEGLDVKLILDGLGSFMISAAALNRLKRSGVEVVWYNKITPEWRLPKWFDRLIHRNHRKVLIVDRETAFLGGVNVQAASYDWNDVFVRLTGRMVRPLLRSFAKSYIECGGDREKIKHLLHPKIMEGWREWKDKFNFVMHSPFYRRYNAWKRSYMRGLLLAEESINLISPYYAPDFRFFKLIAKARRRGVKVNIFLPLRPDHKFMELIARAYYRITQLAGADIYLLKNMNHGKAMTVDNKAGYVGSSNLTRRSFHLNAESGVFFNDEKMTGDLNNLFEVWKKEAELLNRENLNIKPGKWRRFKEWLGIKAGKLV